MRRCHRSAGQTSFPSQHTHTHTLTHICQYLCAYRQTHNLRTCQVSRRRHLQQIEQLPHTTYYSHKNQWPRCQQQSKPAGQDTYAVYMQEIDTYVHIMKNKCIKNRKSQPVQSGTSNGTHSNTLAHTHKHTLLQHDNFSITRT